jgi:hypothetical protein
MYRKSVVIADDLAAANAAVEIPSNPTMNTPFRGDSSRFHERSICWDENHSEDDG